MNFLIYLTAYFLPFLTWAQTCQTSPPYKIEVSYSKGKIYKPQSEYLVCFSSDEINGFKTKEEAIKKAKELFGKSYKFPLDNGIRMSQEKIKKCLSKFKSET